MANDDNAGFLQEKITAGLQDAFDGVIKSRRDDFLKSPDKRPASTEVDRIISSYTRNNSVISGGAGLIPGPWGMAAVAPELILVIKNQIQMIYDIGVANGKEEQITKELLMGIFIAAMGSGAASLLTVHGGKILVKRASLQVIQKLIGMLGGRITQQAIKSAVSKWVPIIGAAAMATWTGYTTKKIGQHAAEIFKMDIVDDPSTIDIEVIDKSK